MPKVISDAQIIEAALDVITQHGYAGATTRQIAAAANINEVTLFRRFGNKQKLLLAVVEQEAENFVTAGIEYTGDVEADLQRIVRFYWGLMQTRGRVITMLMNELPRQPELLEIMQTPFTIVGKICTIIERYQQAGVLSQEPPFQTFVALVGPLFFGGVVQYMQPGLGEDELDLEQQVTHFLRGRLCNRSADT